MKIESTEKIYYWIFKDCGRVIACKVVEQNGRTFFYIGDGRSQEIRYNHEKTDPQEILEDFAIFLGFDCIQLACWNIATDESKTKYIFTE